MNITRISLFFLAVAAFSCSDKESEEPWGLKGSVQGQISLYNEYGVKETDQEGAVVSFQSGSTNMSATTGSDGKFVADDIPMGTYNFVIEKTGFAPRTVSGFKLMGGQNPIYVLMSISRPSTTKVTDLTATLSENTISMTAKIIHNNTAGYPWVNYTVFVGTAADVSPKKYVQAGLYSVAQYSGSSFNQIMYLDRTKFPSGSSAYIVIYGSTNSYTYDLVTGQYVYYGLGDTPSNVASIVIP